MIDWSKSWSWIDKVLPSYRDPPERRMFKVVVLLIIGAIVLMLIISLTTFLLQRYWLGERSYVTVTGKPPSGRPMPLPGTG